MTYSHLGQSVFGQPFGTQAGCSRRAYVGLRPAIVLSPLWFSQRPLRHIRQIRHTYLASEQDPPRWRGDEVLGR